MDDIAKEKCIDIQLLSDIYRKNTRLFTPEEHAALAVKLQECQERK
jgi:hypothetical protein